MSEPLTQTEEGKGPCLGVVVGQVMVMQGILKSEDGVSLLQGTWHLRSLVLQRKPFLFFKLFYYYYYFFKNIYLAALGLSCSM